MKENSFIKVNNKILRQLFRFIILMALMTTLNGCDYYEFYKLRKFSLKRQKELKVKMDSLQHGLDSSNSLRIISDTLVTKQYLQQY